MSIETVAVHSDPDRAEPHVLEADHAVNLPGSTPTETYLDMDAVLGAAKQTRADAIHPGYGFLAENAEFARRVTEEGLIWIGPPPDAIEVMGSKLRSKALVESAGVPTLRAIDLTGNDDVEAAADGLGYPVLVKASAGGGGKGMRIVGDPSGLTEAIEGARREAASSFGDDTVFLEKYLVAPRHIEIQVLGDSQGAVISLFERECSIQRRHQKIIEEAPSPAIDASLRRRMGETAVAVAAAVGYVGAGTVEFLFQDGEFCFLEMNTRLQVEHPVTEMVTGLDLVRLQIEIADGAPIDIQPIISGHAIEARLYAEDPVHAFLPVTGKIHRFDVPRFPGVRVDSGVEDGSMVSVFYDPMLAKVIAHGTTRDEAAELLARALRRALIHGPVTNRELLVRILEHEDFRSGAIDTHFLERHDPGELGRPLADMQTEHLSAVAAALSDRLTREIGPGAGLDPFRVAEPARSLSGEVVSRRSWNPRDPLFGHTEASRGGFGPDRPHRVLTRFCRVQPRRARPQLHRVEVRRGSPRRLRAGTGSPGSLVPLSFNRGSRYSRIATCAHAGKGDQGRSGRR